MSGIAGIVHLDGRPAAREALDPMLHALRHRARDGLHARVLGSAVLGIALTRTSGASPGTQPALSADGCRIAVFDGRIDNDAPLRRELGESVRDGHAALALAVFEAHGAEGIGRIEGDFALALWDARGARLACARDRMGHRPFFHSQVGMTFAFASEPSALLALPWVSRAVNEGMLAEFLADEWRSLDETLWRDVRRLPAAHGLQAGYAATSSHRYWQPAPPQPVADAEYVSRYGELLADSVSRCSAVRDALAVEVSGGLDSSAVFAVAAGLGREGRLAAPCLWPATMTFDDPAADERTQARAVAAHVGIEVREIAGELPSARAHAERARKLADFPGFPNAWMRRTLLACAADEGCRVLLTGEGGDAWLEGDRTYYAEELARGDWRALSECFAADARDFGPWQAGSWLARQAARELLPASVVAAARRLRAREPAPSWLSPRLREALRSRRGRAAPEPKGVPAGARRLLALLDDPFTAHVGEWIERVAALHAIELRHPLQDPRLVELAMAMPERLRLQGDLGKRVHRRALEGLLPACVLARRTKADFSALLVAELAAAKPAVEELARRRADWLDPAGVRALFARLARGERWPLWPLWAIHGCGAVLDPGG